MLDSRNVVVVVVLVLVAIRVLDARYGSTSSGSDATFNDSPAFAASSLIVLAARRTVPERAATLDAGLDGGGIISASRAIRLSLESVVRGLATSLLEISRIPREDDCDEGISSGSGVPEMSHSLTVET